jgi:hypothetical protein
LSGAEAVNVFAVVAVRAMDQVFAEQVEACRKEWRRAAKKGWMGT